MAEVSWQARRTLDSVLVDVTADIEGSVQGAPNPNPIEGGGGGLANPVTEPLVIEPTDNTSPPLQIIPAAGTTANAFLLNVKDITDGDAFTVTGEGQVQVIPNDMESGTALFVINDPRAIDDFETVLQVSRGASSLLELYTAGQLQLNTRHADAGLHIVQQTTATDPLKVQSSGFARLFGVTSTGAVVTKANAAPADGDLAAGEMAIWFDSTNGAAKLMIKAKQADGTVRTGSVNLT